LQAETKLLKEEYEREQDTYALLVVCLFPPLSCPAPPSSLSLSTPSAPLWFPSPPYKKKMKTKNLMRILHFALLHAFNLSRLCFLFFFLACSLNGSSFLFFVLFPLVFAVTLLSFPFLFRSDL
jgi:hypothetical protein